MQPSTTDTSTAKQALLEALLSDAGLKSLTQTASAAMDNPVLVVDPVYRYAARGGFELDDDDDSPFAAITRAELSEGDMLQDEAVRYIIKCGLDEEIARSTGPLTRYNDMFRLNTMTDAIKVHGTCLGRAMMIERNHAFGDRIARSLSSSSDCSRKNCRKAAFFRWAASNRGHIFSRASWTTKSPTPSPAHAKCSSSALRRFPPSTLYACSKKIPSSRRARRRASEDNCSRYCTIALSPCTKVSSWRW